MGPTTSALWAWSADGDSEVVDLSQGQVFVGVVAMLGVGNDEEVILGEGHFVGHL